MEESQASKTWRKAPAGIGAESSVLAVSPEATSQRLGIPRHQTGDPALKPTLLGEGSLHPVELWLSLSTPYLLCLCLCLFTSEKAVTNQRSEFIQIQFGKSVSSLGMLMGSWGRVCLQGHGWGGLSGYGWGIIHRSVNASGFFFYVGQRERTQ